VTGDPYEAFAPGAMSISSPEANFFESIYPKLLRKDLFRGTAVAYVTEHTLQERYPCANFSVGVSDVDLPNEAFLNAARSFKARQKSYTIVTIASLAQLYKAPDVLIGFCESMS